MLGASPLGATPLSSYSPFSTGANEFVAESHISDLISVSASAVVVPGVRADIRLPLVVDVDATDQPVTIYAPITLPVTVSGTLLVRITGDCSATIPIGVAASGITTNFATVAAVPVVVVSASGFVAPVGAASVVAPVSADGDGELLTFGVARVPLRPVVSASSAIGSLGSSAIVVPYAVSVQALRSVTANAVVGISLSASAASVHGSAGACAVSLLPTVSAEGMAFTTIDGQADIYLFALVAARGISGTDFTGADCIHVVSKQYRIEVRS